jgi:uroporphyrinogen-III synthase
MDADLLILRSEAAGKRTALKAQAMGLSVAQVPLFRIDPMAWKPVHPDDIEALMLTSAHAVAMAGDLLALYLDVPLYCVGAATAQAARHFGFKNIYTGQHDAQALIDEMAEHGVEYVLHLCGEDHHAPKNGWMKIQHVPVYAARAVTPPPALPNAEVILVHSARAGAYLAEIMPDAERASHHIVAISAQAAGDVGSGWHSVRSAITPNDDALLDIAKKLCHGKLR